MSILIELPLQSPRRTFRYRPLVSVMVSTGLLVMLFVLLTRLYCSNVVKQARLGTGQRSH